MPYCGVHYLWFAFVCLGERGGRRNVTQGAGPTHPPPLDPPTLKGALLGTPIQQRLCSQLTPPCFGEPIAQPHF